jgi:hypothetical protein
VKERRRKGAKLPFQREKNENFLDSESILLEPSEIPNTSASNLFLSHSCEASEWQGTLSGESTVPLRASVFHPSMKVFFFFFR